MGDKRRGQNFICKNHHILEIVEISRWEENKRTLR